jgi:hypothetical protein
LQLSRTVLNSPNNVLDLKDSLIILITLFFNNNYNRELIYKLSTFLVSGVWAQFMLIKNQKNLWVFIRKLLNSFDSSKSSFIKSFYSSVLEYVSYRSVKEKSLYLDKENYWDFGNDKQQDEFLFINKNSSCCFEAPDSFYVQDEISFSSPTMLAASERMGIFYKTY